VIVVVSDGKRDLKKRMRAYLAGPFGFSEAGRHYQDTVLTPALGDAGVDVVDPWKLADAERIAAVAAMAPGPGRMAAWRELNEDIGRTNARAIDSCEAVIAVLDGVDVDSGTAAEIGYAFAKGKRILGYRGDFRLSSDNEGARVNLQVEYFIHASGGAIAASLEELLKAMAELKL